MALTSVPQTDPPGDRASWHDWCNWGYPRREDDPSPYQHTYVEAWRREWQAVEVLRVRDMHPAMNVWNLWWRPLQRPKLEPEATNGWRSPC
jgi:hypothetical protein